MPANNDLWENDTLNRQEEGGFLADYLIRYYENNTDSPFVLNINAEWGFGKTYFLTNIAKDLDNKNYPVVYFDAWKNDYSDQPLLAFMDELDKSLTPYFTRSEKAQKLFKGSMKAYMDILISLMVKQLTGLSVESFMKGLEDETTEEEDEVTDTSEEFASNTSTVLNRFAERTLQGHRGTKESIEEFKSSMKKLLKQIDTNMTRELPMFIFIDELDRCRPNYALELLENIKHIFDIPGIIFVIATDSKQLAHSVNAVYGEKFASERYLKRFFDQEYTLINPDSYSYAYYLFSKYELLENAKLYSPIVSNAYTDANILVKLFAGYVDYFKLGLRDQEQIILVLYSITLLWNQRTKLHLGYLLFLIMLKQKSSELFEKYMDLENKGQFPRMLSEYVNESILFKSSTNIGYGARRPSNIAVGDLINEYINLLDFDRGSNVNFDQISDNTIYNAKYKVFEELPSSWSGDNPPKHQLNDYPSLVLQAGQLS